MEKGTKERDGGTRLTRQQRVELASRTFEEYRDVIRTILLFNLGDQADADDIFQDFFLSLVDKPVPTDIQNVKGYLCRAVTNDIIDASRRAKGYTARLRRYAGIREEKDANYKDPQSIVSQGEEIQEMFRLIERHLPPREAEAVIERFGEDHDIDEGAKRMGVNKRTFSRYVCTGLKKVRDLL